MLSITDDRNKTLFVRHEDIDHITIGDWSCSDVVTTSIFLELTVNVKTKNGDTTSLHFFQKKLVLEKHHQRTYIQWYRDYEYYPEYIGCCCIIKNPNPPPVLDEEVDDAIANLKQREKYLLKSRRDEIAEMFNFE